MSESAANRPSSNLPAEVSEAAASGEVARLYDEIRRALRSPSVNLIYRLLASYPAYLAAAWAQIGPNLASHYLEREAERLRSLAALEVGAAAGSLSREVASLGLPAADLASIRATIDLFNYANPKNLIVICALRLAAEGQPMNGSGDAAAGQPVPQGPLPAVEVRLLERSDMQPVARAVLDEVLAEHQTGGATPSVYRALANWPAFLKTAWRAVRPYVQAPAFAEGVARLVREAERAAQGLPYPVRLGREETVRLAGTDGAGRIHLVLDRFSRSMIPAMSVEIHTLKALLDGADAARSSPFAWRG